MLNQPDEESLLVEWKIPISRTAKMSENQFKDIIGAWSRNPTKNEIILSSDPLSETNFKPAKETTDSLIQTIMEGKHNGYAPSVGYEDARQAVSNFLLHDGISVDAKDIILCSGCSSSLDLCIGVLADGVQGQNILIPKPANPIYQILTKSLGIEVRQYELLPDYNWEVDIFDLETKIDLKTAAIIINNPSNPSGAVFRENHLREIVEIAYKHKIPIISDESYQQLAFPEHKFISAANVSSRVPILICGSLGKGFLVSGWRLGWIIIHDPIGAFEQVRKGLISLSQRIIGCNTVIQGSLTSVLQTTPQSFKDDLINTLRESARIAFDAINTIEGLIAYKTQGTMYMMVKIQIERFRSFQSSLDFAKALYGEESVLCIPGELFCLPGFMRISLLSPNDKFMEAVQRIYEFTERYKV